MRTVARVQVSEFLRENVFTPFHERVFYPLGAFVLVLAMASVVVLLVTQGIQGALWSYPMVMLTYFVLRRRWANPVSVAMLLGATGLVHASLGGAMALRFFLSLALCLVVVNIILGVLDTLHGRLLALSLTDPLTGAFNRRHMDSSLADAIERHRRTRSPASLVLIDIDHFKAVNDRFGHDAGDRVLKAIVTLIGRRSRKLDQLFRMGGEEFLLLLPDTEATDAMVVAEHVRTAIARERLLPNWRVTVSVGVSQLHSRDRADDWLKRVDDAMYRAKAAGRNRMVATGTWWLGVSRGALARAA